MELNEILRSLLKQKEEGSLLFGANDDAIKDKLNDSSNETIDFLNNYPDIREFIIRTTVIEGTPYILDNSGVVEAVIDYDSLTKVACCLDDPNVEQIAEGLGVAPDSVLNYIQSARVIGSYFPNDSDDIQPNDSDDSDDDSFEDYSEDDSFEDYSEDDEDYSEDDSFEDLDTFEDDSEDLDTFEDYSEDDDTFKDITDDFLSYDSEDDDSFEFSSSPFDGSVDILGNPINTFEDSGDIFDDSDELPLKDIDRLVLEEIFHTSYLYCTDFEGWLSSEEGIKVKEYLSKAPAPIRNYLNYAAQRG